MNTQEKKLTPRKTGLFALAILFGLTASSSLFALQYARPDGTTAAGSFSHNGTSHHEVIDEISFDDSDFISTSTDNDAITFTLGDPTDPASYVNNHTIRWRDRSQGSGGGEKYNIAILASGVSVWNRNNVTANRSASAFGLNEYVLPDATGIAGNYANLTVEINGVNIGTNESIQISWLEFEIPDAAAVTPPTVDTLTVTGVTASQAVLGATVGGTGVTERGTVWKTSSPVTLTDDPQVSVDTAATFTDTRTLLSASTQVFYRAYATNTGGTTLSTEEDSFWTEPSSQPTSVTFSNVLATSMDISWSGGDGTGSIVFVKAGAAVDFTPADFNEYTSAANFGTSTQYGTGNYAVYINNGSTVSVTGLASNTTYHVAVFEYAGTGSGSTGINYRQVSVTNSQITDTQTAPLI